MMYNKKMGNNGFINNDISDDLLFADSEMDDAKPAETDFNWGEIAIAGVTALGILACTFFGLKERDAEQTQNTQTEITYPVSQERELN